MSGLHVALLLDHSMSMLKLLTVNSSKLAVMQDLENVFYWTSTVTQRHFSSFSKNVF